MSAGAPGPASPVPSVKALKCPNCGAQLVVRSFQNAVTIVCVSCHSILDAKDPNLRILQKFEAIKGEDQPLIPLGTRGKIRGAQYEVIGFQRRTIEVEGVNYSWHEYLLFNPYKGFRYLTEYNGHWNDTSPLRSLPTFNNTTPPTVTYLGETYKHFQTAQPETRFVLGEFPWQVRVGELATCTDYVKPPRVISSEVMQKEVTWSMGEYMSGKDVWQAFSLPGNPPDAIGVYENQPSPFSASTAAIWTYCALFIGLVVVCAILFAIAARNEIVFTNAYNFKPAVKGEASFVTDPFELKGHASGVEIKTTADVSNNWIYINYALINQDTGEAYDFGREISYYTGRDSDGPWSEGSNLDAVVVPGVPPGHYYLRIEPEGNVGGRSVAYTVTVTRGVPIGLLFLLAAGALLLPAILITWRSVSFEHMRWAESDSAPSGSSE